MPKINFTIAVLVWLVLLSIPFITVNSITPFWEIDRNPLVILNLIQRLSGLMLFTLITVQITLGSRLGDFLQLLGSRAYRLHILLGISIYTLVILHPLMEMSIVNIVSGSIVEALLTILPNVNDQREIYLTFGKTAFLFLTLSVSFAYFRTFKPLRKVWHKIHILNYAVFYIMYWHMRVGTDIMTPPFSYFSWMALGSVTILLLLRFLKPLIKNNS